MLELQTDEDQVRFLLEVTERKTEFVPWKRKVDTVVRTYRIYEKRKSDKGITTYQINYGWIPYLLNTFIQRIGKDDYNALLHDVVYSSSYRTYPFNELRDYQNEDVLHLLKYKRGLLSCYTSYGYYSVDLI